MLTEGQKGERTRKGTQNGKKTRETADSEGLERYIKELSERLDTCVSELLTQMGVKNNRVVRKRS
jgi:hypothetical protein